MKVGPLYQRIKNLLVNTEGSPHLVSTPSQKTNKMKNILILLSFVMLLASCSKDCTNKELGGQIYSCDSENQITLESSQSDFSGDYGVKFKSQFIVENTYTIFINEVEHTRVKVNGECKIGSFHSTDINKGDIVHVVLDDYIFESVKI